MKRVLIISPHFPPVNAPDHQRVRMALPYFQSLGWEAVVLAVDPRDVEVLCDPFLEKTLPSDCRLQRIRAWPVRLTRCFGVGSLGLRSYRALRKAGDDCLAREKFDLVFFSTTVFPVTLLGPRWKERFGVPYVVDFQDPWLSDYPYNDTDKPAPGGHFRYGVSQRLAAWAEPRVLRDAAALVSVSLAYPEQWKKRYTWAAQKPVTILSFGAPEHDFELMTPGDKPELDPRFKHWVYVGRGGDDMALALRGFFKALREMREEKPFEINRLRVHFLGTDYAPAGKGRPTIAPIAQEEGVADLVEERTDRLPYGKSLGWLLAADALIVPGSDDPAYTASKIYPYVLAGKPLLAIFHEASSAGTFLRETRAGTLVSFADGESPSVLCQKIRGAWFGAAGPTVNTPDPEAMKRYTARSMTKTLLRVFDDAARPGSRS